jgi:hypothetical protein
MSLPALEWRKLPVRIPTASYSSNYLLATIYDMLTGSLYINGAARVIGSGSAWSASGRFTTGSNVEAVYCRPPRPNTFLSQSVIFSTKSSTAPFSAAIPPVVTNEAPFSSSVVHVACVKNATGAFTQWTSQFPFGSSSYSTGYAKGFNAVYYASASKISIYESKEAIAISIYSPITASSCIIAGAIVDPETEGITSSFDSEQDGRLYGVATSGCAFGTASNTATPISTTFLTPTYNAAVAGAFLSHDTTTSTNALGYPKFVMFTPRGNALYTFAKGGLSNSSYYTSASLTRSGSLVQTAIPCYDSINLRFAGKIRDITPVRSQFNNTIVRNPAGTIIGYALSANETVATTHTVLFSHS